MFTLDASGFTMMVSALALGAGLGTAIGFHLGMREGAKTMLEVSKDQGLVAEPEKKSWGGTSRAEIERFLHSRPDLERPKWF